jgi:hypothetical protein
MRRPTFIMLIVLFLLLVGAGVAQLVIASRHHAPYRGPANPTELPSLPTGSP